ncbi:inactive tyrosine-protein kinase transmembrane receptor ROR1-like isoform X1 [Tachypleus tridentatus]|uniref:inactive tyrosine-protein kinase transmembrane receptor ROR1-like isoform X1 n=1 Tax=Tachypleus tridentatus TaxID=6853 RepID=UPI003FD2881E
MDDLADEELKDHFFSMEKDDISSTSQPEEEKSDKGPSSTFIRVERPLVNITRDLGRNVKMKCGFHGHPTPQIKWYKNEAPLEEGQERVDIRSSDHGEGHVSSRLRILHLDSLDSAFYKCEARSGKNVAETTGILKVNAGVIRSPVSVPDFSGGFPHRPPVSVPNFSGGLPHFPGLGKSFPDFEDEDGKFSEGICQVYRSATCSKFLANKTVFVGSIHSQGIMEEKLAAAFSVIASSQDVSSECHKYAIPSLCFYAFPPCDTNSSVPKPRHVCRDECEVLENSICRLEYSIAKRHPLIGQQKILPACEDLPPFGSKASETCVRLGVPNSIKKNEEHTCYVGTGEDYEGTLSHTISGHKCQHWSHQIFYRTSDYPELIGGHNFCRNPGGMENQPWCFIADPQVRKEMCHIPKCVDYLWLYILLPSIVLVVLIGLLLGIWCMKRRSKPNPSAIKTPKAVTRPQNEQGTNQQVEMNALLPRTQFRAHEYPLSSIRFLQELGEGAFGKVYHGELVGIHGIGSVAPVAIKTLKENATLKTRQDFQREAELMSDLHHPNIVCLLGACTREEPLCMLFEYMSQGDLHEYLILHSPRSDVRNSEDEPYQILELSDFLHITRQIAGGMEYLAGNHYVHRDLAARNCLVGDGLVVKISDFGLSRDIYSSDYYRVQSKSLLPVRWMPPESILYGKFTTESDVWSFGVVLWETFSYGLQPYYGYNNQEVIDMIRSRKLLPCPEDCPPHIYAMMVECWHENPSRRPSFKELYARLCSWQTMHTQALSVAQSGNGSHHSSAGPSNNTVSTNLSSPVVGPFTSSGGLASTSCGVPFQRAINVPVAGSIQQVSFGTSTESFPTFHPVRSGTPILRPVDSLSRFTPPNVPIIDGKVSNV